jgi:two-component system nitrogen regulation response regulator GlnG
MLPPLRERREDIAELAHYFLFRHNRRLSTAAQSISQEAMELLENHEWPGNVRELQNTIHEALIAASGPSILPDFLPMELHRNGQSDPAAPAQLLELPDGDMQGLQKFVEMSLKAGETDIYRRARDFFDRFVILRAMQQVGGNQHRAAELLGLSRVTLRARLRALNLSVEQVVVSPGKR